MARDRARHGRITVPGRVALGDIRRLRSHWNWHVKHGKHRRNPDIPDSLRIASENTSSHEREVARLIDRLPNGTDIKGYVKSTLPDGSIFWVGRGRGLTSRQLYVQVGATAIGRAIGLSQREVWNTYLKSRANPRRRSR